MFNWWGNHKIGVVGSAHSGKTVLLTSLLWHLEYHDPEKFKLGKTLGTTRVQDFKYVRNKKYDFNFEANRNSFITKHSWPDKTTDFGLAECRYQHSDGFPAAWVERHLTFVDIPGERTADILIWKAKNYAEWVELLYAYWNDNQCAKEKMMPYWEKVERFADFNTLKKEYKAAMYGMGESFLPITPSTFLLGCDGSTIGDANNRNREKVISSRPIWSGGELFPVPLTWKNKYQKEYKDLENTFKRYKAEVLKPFLKEIDACDNFIFCVDIFEILESGPFHLLLRQGEFKKFIEHFAPAKFKRIFNKIGGNPPRLAFVATKSDMVCGNNSDHLQGLLKDFAKPLTSCGGIKYDYFTCSAYVSTKYSEERNTLICQEYYDGQYWQMVIPGNIPERWPDTETWKERINAGEWCWPKDMKPEVLSSSAPEQINLDRLLEFVIEGKTR